VSEKFENIIFIILYILYIIIPAAGDSRIIVGREVRNNYKK
jgi:hypothetical protein